MDLRSPTSRLSSQSQRGFFSAHLSPRADKFCLSESERGALSIASKMHAATYTTRVLVAPNPLVLNLAILVGATKSLFVDLYKMDVGQGASRTAVLATGNARDPLPFR